MNYQLINYVTAGTTNLHPVNERVGPRLLPWIRDDKLDANVRWLKIAI
jgi:hypothetical protein